MNFNIRKEALTLARELGLNVDLGRVQFHWSRSYQIYGITGAEKRITNWVVKSIGISNRFDLDYETFRGILAHELLHVYLFQTVGNHTHDYRFRSVIGDIEKQCGFKIPVYYDLKKLSHFDLGEKITEPLSLDGEGATKKSLDNPLISAIKNKTAR